MDAMWQEYGMEELEKGMQKLFPASRISVAELMGQLLQGRADRVRWRNAMRGPKP